MYVLELTAAAVSEKSIKERMCFVCGNPPSTGSGEHVIPLWLQRKCNLFDETLTLLNGTRLPYRKLTVPCCNACNTGFLSSIEKAVQPIFDSGEINTTNEKLMLGRWLSKLLIGFLVKETSLLIERSKPESEPIVPVNFLEELQHCHFILNTARKATIFRCLHGDLPFSLYYYKVSNEVRTEEFDLSTNILGNSVAIRIGGLAVIFINDGGLQMEIAPMGPFDLLGETLSEFQFQELAARVHYKAALRDATHTYITSENEGTIIIDQFSVKSYSGLKPGSRDINLFRKWDELELSHVIENYTKLKRSAIYDEEAKSCTTIIVDENGNLQKASQYLNLPSKS